MSQPRTQASVRSPFLTEKLITIRMRRSLVLTNESARHPFRASLMVRPDLQRDRMTRSTRWSLSQNDWVGFLGAYVACLVGALVFIF